MQIFDSLQKVCFRDCQKHVSHLISCPRCEGSKFLSLSSLIDFFVLFSLSFFFICHSGSARTAFYGTRFGSSNDWEKRNDWYRCQGNRMELFLMYWRFFWIGLNRTRPVLLSRDEMSIPFASISFCFLGQKLSSKSCEESWERQTLTSRLETTRSKSATLHGWCCSRCTYHIRSDSWNGPWKNLGDCSRGGRTFFKARCWSLVSASSTEDSNNCRSRCECSLVFIRRGVFEGESSHG